MQNGFVQVGPQFANFAKLCGEFSRAFTGHVFVNDAALLFCEVVFQRPTKALSLDGLGDHSPPSMPKSPSRSRLTSTVRRSISLSFTITARPSFAVRASWLRLADNRARLAYSSRFIAGTGGDGRRRDNAASLNHCAGVMLMVSALAFKAMYSGGDTRTPMVRSRTVQIGR